MTLYAFWAMARPSQLIAVIVVTLTGMLVAHSHGHPISIHMAIFGLIALLPVAASIHYANEYADYDTDQLTQATPFSGGSGASHLVPRRWALIAAWVALTIGLLFAVACCFVHGLSLTAIGVLLIGAFGGWMYSLPPLKLAWRGWGELDNALLGGLLLMVYGYVLFAGRIDAVIVVAALPFTALVFANLLATTWPDRQADAQVGKYTLATQHHRHTLRRLYSLTLAIVVVSALLVYPAILPDDYWLLKLPVMPLLIWGWWHYTRSESPHPTVFAMITLMVAQLVAWGFVALTV